METEESALKFDSEVSEAIMNESRPVKRKIEPVGEAESKALVDPQPFRRKKKAMEILESNTKSRWESKDDSESLNDLMKTFASMSIPETNDETCPLCFKSFKLEEFSDHVHSCLEKMEGNKKIEASSIDTSDDSHCFPGGECKFGIYCKITTADHFRFLKHPKVRCPVCSDSFHMYEINAHITFCIEMGEDDDEMKETAAKSEDEGKSGNMSTRQMAACAKAILKAKSKNDDDSVVSMLQRFKSLGFTRENLKNRLKEIKESPEEKKT
mmetsp:Transcript_4238/g.6303  ORF Transcript_4238/g.6303 Transcript_4238/m.6303 type:complete len:268 (-) Transcript_4238:135-938(-)